MTLRMTQAEVDAHRRRMAGWANAPAMGVTKRLDAVRQAVFEGLDGKTLKATLPMRLRSVLNSRVHPLKRHGWAKTQRNLIRNNIGAGMLPKLPATITLTRVGPRMLDGHDNLRSAFKATVDALAELYGVDDSSDLFDWQYAQEKGGKGEYACHIEIASKSELRVTPV